MAKTVLLIGLGRFGMHIAKALYEIGQEVMAVDWDEDKINEVMPYVTDAQIGDSTKQAFLDTLGVEDYDLCYVTIGNNFQSSLETTSLLHELGAKCVISRADSEVQKKFLLRNGADEVIYMEKQMARWAAIRYSSHHILDYVPMDADNSLLEIAVPKEWQGISIKELDIRKKYHISILALKADGRYTIDISPDTVLAADETMLVIGKHKNLQKCFHI